MHNYPHFSLNQCRIVFFDLEYYVPQKHRRQSGLNYNPWLKECKLLGGTFFNANPSTDIQCDSESIIKSKRMKSFWLWNEKNEAALVKKIFEYLNQIKQTMHRATNGNLSPLLCGIGISASDVPALIDLFKRYRLLTNAEAFRFQNSFRIIDLSQLSIACFNPSNAFIKPKTKNELLTKFKHKQTFESGKNVWSLFENKRLKLIESRVVDEIIATHHIYKQLLLSFRQFKQLEEKEKKRQKEISN